jgi:hypothetical protein
MAEPQQHFQMTTEIATRAGSHSRRTFDDKRCQKRGRQVSERSDSSSSAGIAQTRGNDAGTHESCSPSVRIQYANIFGIQEPLIQVEMGGGDDYALPEHHWPAAASDVSHSQYQLHVFAARLMSLSPLRAEPTIRTQIHQREKGRASAARAFSLPCLCGLSPTRASRLSPEPDAIAPRRWPKRRPFPSALSTSPTPRHWRRS